MVSIAVLDDQVLYLQMIEEITMKCMAEQEIAYEIVTYNSWENLLSDIEEDNKYDIYLLDVELPDTTGLEVARKIREKYFELVIIYITNHVQYAIGAYETNAYRYIPKRMLEEKLPEALVSICGSLKNKKKDFYIIELYHKIERIAYDDIYYVKKDEKYILLVHRYGRSRDRKTMAEFVKCANCYGKFIGVDRGYVVNAVHVMKLENQQIVLRNGDFIPVSKPKLKFVKQEIMRIWRR